MSIESMSLEEKKALPPNYKSWVVDGNCEPPIAASLILGLQPLACFTQDGPDLQSVKILVKEVRIICAMLCQGDRSWWLYRNLSIFDHVNTAIKNRIEIAKPLLQEITAYFENHLPKDKEHFINKYPYLARELKLSINSKEKKMPNADITEKERPQILQLILGMAMDKYGYIPGASKNNATGNKKDSIRAALQRFGLDVDEDTIRKYLNEAYEAYPEAKAAPKY